MASERDDQGPPQRFFFSTTRDLYFLTYTIAVIIHKTQTKKGGLVDARKLPFLVPFVADARTADIVARRHHGLPISLDDRIRVHAAETEGRRLRPLIHRLVFSLSQRGLLQLHGSSPLGMEVRLPDQSPLMELASAALFQYEQQNMRRILDITRIRTVRLDTLRERLFFLNGGI